MHLIRIACILCAAFVATHTTQAQTLEERAVAAKLFTLAKKLDVDKQGVPKIKPLVLINHAGTFPFGVTRATVGDLTALRLLIPMTYDNDNGPYRAVLVVDDIGGTGTVTHKHVLHFAWPITRDPLPQEHAQIIYNQALDALEMFTLRNLEGMR